MFIEIWPQLKRNSKKLQMGIPHQIKKVLFKFARLLSQQQLKDLRKRIIQKQPSNFTNKPTRVTSKSISAIGHINTNFDFGIIKTIFSGHFTIFMTCGRSEKFLKNT